MDRLEGIINNIYESLLEDDRGNVADYIPELASVDPSMLGISVCMVNGECLNKGDFDKFFCLFINNFIPKFWFDSTFGTFYGQVFFR